MQPTQAWSPAGGSAPAAELRHWAQALQAALCTSNPHYLDYALELRFAPAEVRLLRCGAFASLRDEAIARGAAEQQCKPPMVAKRQWERQLLERWWWRAEGGAAGNEE